jgi:hypothetical protein
MTNDPPVNFEQKRKEPPSSSGGYPVQIKANDLDKNFVFATLIVSENWINEKTGTGGHKQRELKLPASIDAPSLFVFENGDPAWLEAPDGNCLLYWGLEENVPVWLEQSENPAVLVTKQGGKREPEWLASDENPTILAFNKDGELVWIEKPDGGDPTILTFDKDGEIVWLERPDGQAALIFNGDGEPEWLKPPATGTAVLGSVDGAIQWLETEDCD